MKWSILKCKSALNRQKIELKLPKISGPRAFGLWVYMFVLRANAKCGRIEHTAAFTKQLRVCDRQMFRGHCMVSNRKRSLAKNNSR